MTSITSLNRTLYTDLESVFQNRSGTLDLNVWSRLLSNAHQFIEGSKAQLLSEYSLPDRAEDFHHWLEQLLDTHPAPKHEVYSYLGDYGDLDDLRFFITQESTVDHPFADYIALCQAGLSGKTKQELAENYWDEMGAGDPALEHATLFEQALEELNIPSIDQSQLIDSAMQCGNLLRTLCYFGQYSLLAVGALSATEDAVPWRFECILNAAERNRMGTAFKRYYQIHIEADVGHAQGWTDNVVIPLLSAHPDNVKQLAMGVLLRLDSSRVYCDQMLEHLRANNEIPELKEASNP